MVENEDAQIQICDNTKKQMFRILKHYIPKPSQHAELTFLNPPSYQAPVILITNARLKPRSTLTLILAKGLIMLQSSESAQTIEHVGFPIRDCDIRQVLLSSHRVLNTSYLEPRFEQLWRFQLTFKHPSRQHRVAAKARVVKSWLIQVPDRQAFCMWMVRLRQAQAYAQGQ